MNFKLLLLVITISSSLIWACSKQIENVANDSTNTEQHSFRNETTRSYLIGLHISKLKVEYHKLSPSQKLDVWSDKFNVILAKEELTQNERRYIKTLQEHLRLELFESGSDKQPTIDAVNQWMTEAQNALGWEEEKVLLMTSTLFTPTEVSARLNMISNGIGLSPPPPTPACNCQYNYIGCALHTAGAQTDCSDDGCEITADDGCGIFYTQRCLGVCK